MFLGSRNDGWRFNFTINDWTWIGGASTLNAVGRYSNFSLATPQNEPGARQTHAGVYHPGTRTWYVYGGEGYASTTTLGT